MTVCRKILVMGLPGSGKTTLSVALRENLESLGWSVSSLNADEIRARFDDWDFSVDGRIRQARRMADLAAACTTDCVISDFVAPLPEMRDIFAADWTVLMDTVIRCKYDDTNGLFQRPISYEFCVQEKDAEKYAPRIAARIHQGKPE